MTKDEKNNKLIGGGVSIALHTLVVFLFILLAAAKIQPDVKEEGGGGGGGNPAGEGEGASPGEPAMAMMEVEFQFSDVPEMMLSADISAPTLSAVEKKQNPTNNPTNRNNPTQTQTSDPVDPRDDIFNALNGGGGQDDTNGGGKDGKGGGDKGGNGPGNGKGFGEFKGDGNGLGSTWELKGRDIKNKPSTGKKPTSSGTVVLRITVDQNGRVTKATVKSTTLRSDHEFNHNLAIEAAKNATFTASPNSTPVVGEIVIYLSVK